MDAEHATSEAQSRIEQAEKAWLLRRRWRRLGIAVTCVGLLALTSLPRWRLLLVAAAFALNFVGVGLIYLRWLGARDPASRQNRVTSSVGFALGLLNCLWTGGLDSPLIFLPMASLTAMAMNVRGAAVRWMFAALVCALIGFAFLPVSFTEGLFTPTEHRLVMAYVLVVFAAVLVLSLARNRARLNEMALALERARGDLLEAAAERKRALEMLGAKVAHELRNPLGAIKALVDLENRATADERSRRRFEVVLGEIKRMEQILRDYLSSARPLEELELAPVRLEAIADDAMAVLEGRANEQGVALRRLGDGVAIRGDARRLKETLLNIASNAIDATPRGGKVDIVVEASGGEARVVVRDQGHGMNQTTLARVGTPFFTTRKNGTGLGVVIARSIVQQHGGALTYAAAPEGGTVATITLPAALGAT